MYLINNIRKPYSWDASEGAIEFTFKYLPKMWGNDYLKEMMDS